MTPMRTYISFNLYDIQTESSGTAYANGPLSIRTQAHELYRNLLNFKKPEKIYKLINKIKLIHVKEVITSKL